MTPPPPGAARLKKEEPTLNAAAASTRVRVRVRVTSHHNRTVAHGTHVRAAGQQAEGGAGLHLRGGGGGGHQGPAHRQASLRRRRHQGAHVT